MTKNSDQNNMASKAEQGKRPWSKPELIDLNFSQTAVTKARVQASEIAIFSDKAPTEEWGPS